MAMQRYDDVLQTKPGNVVTASSVTVVERDSGNIATIYSDEGTTAITNPMTTDVNGHFWFYAADGPYVLQFADGTKQQILLGDGTHREAYVVKSVDTPKVNNSVALVNDDELLFAIAANETWYFDIVAKPVSNGTADLKWDITAPAAATWTRKVSYIFRNTLTERLQHSNSPFATVDSYSGTRVMDATTFLHIYGAIVNGVNAGNVQLRYAQRIANVSDTYLDTGSWLVARRIG